MPLLTCASFHSATANTGQQRNRRDRLVDRARDAVALKQTVPLDALRQREVVHVRHLLALSQNMATFRTSTKARDLIVVVAIELVVEGQLLTRQNVADREDPHGAGVARLPLLDLAVGVATVVNEARGVALVSGVNELIGTQTHVVHVQLALPLLRSSQTLHASLHGAARSPAAR